VRCRRQRSGRIRVANTKAPRGEIEEVLAEIWQELLRVDRVGRQDNFFELGGHSLLIVQMKERLRRVGLSVEVRSIFESSTLTSARVHAGRQIGRARCGAAELDFRLGVRQSLHRLLPLVDLEPEQIERIVQTVPGGAGNVQDIYPLAPLQEGFCFITCSMNGAETRTFCRPYCPCPHEQY